MKTVDVGYFKDVAILQRSFDDYVVIDVSFADTSVPNGLHDFDNERCYVVKKADLDAYMARKESLEHMNCTPVWDAYNRLKAKVNELEAENDELLRLRGEVKELKIQIEMLEAANTDWAKQFLAMTKSRDYFEEKADSVEKKYEELVAEHTKLQAELMEIKTTRTLREAYIAGVEKGCESLREDRDYWKNRCNSVMTDVSNALSANGIEFTVKDVLGDVNWKLEFDIPELNEAKKKISELEQKLRLAESRESYWRDRKEEEEDYHHYWLHTYNLAVGHASNKGVHIFITGEDAENNVGVILVKNEKADELEAKWSAMLQALKEKGVEVLYMGEEDGKPNIDVKIPAVGDLKKELEDLKSKTVAEVRYEWKPNCFTMIYTKCDGSKQTVGMDLADDTDDEKSTFGSFVCRSFDIPQCKNCKNHRYYGKISGHFCHLPDSKCIIPNTFDIFPLTDEEAEGPACDKFEAKE